MDSVKDIINNLSESSESIAGEEIILNPDYLRKSSALISEALQKGYDVLQLDNGDIVTTGTKVVVTQYHWDGEENKMVKVPISKRRKKSSDSLEKDI